MIKIIIAFIAVFSFSVSAQSNPEWIVIDTSNSVIPSNHIEEIVIDNLNRKWISLYENGILKIEDGNWSIFNASNSVFPNNIITTMNFDKNLNFWAGGYGFITKFDGNTWTVWINPTPGVIKTSINFDEQNDVWFLSRNDNTIFSIHYLAEFSEDSIWTTHSSFNTENGSRQMLFDNDASGLVIVKDCSFSMETVFSLFSHRSDLMVFI